MKILFFKKQNQRMTKNSKNGELKIEISLKEIMRKLKMSDIDLIPPMFVGLFASLASSLSKHDILQKTIFFS